MFVVKEFEKKNEEYKQKTTNRGGTILMKTIVLGPPGTGKTTTLLNKVDDYLKHTDPDKIGYFTFTQKACTKKRQRAEKI